MAETQVEKTLFGGALPGTVSLVLILLAAFLFMQSLKTFRDFSLAGSEIPPVSVITVTGEGEVLAKPDIAVFTFGVTENADTPDAAQKAAATKINDAISFVEGSGIDKDDIKTLSFNIMPRYETVRTPCVRLPCPTRQNIIGYTVEQTMEVKLRDTGKAGALVVGLAEKGLQNVSGPNFQIDDDEKLRADARSLAIEDAKEKANALAKNLGVRLVRIVNFSEGFDRPIPFYRQAATMDGVGMGGAVAPNMPTGENQIRSTVSITYEIR